MIIDKLRIAGRVGVSSVRHGHSNPEPFLHHQERLLAKLAKIENAVVSNPKRQICLCLFMSCVSLAIRKL